MTAPVEAVAPAVRRRAIDAARGTAAFDLLLAGGTVVDVATGELRPLDVGIVGPLIASVHPAGSRDDAAETLDATGRWIAPGFIDMHVHVESSMLTPAAYAEAVCPRGTTTIFTDPHELANVGGVEAVRWFVEASRGLPVRFLVQAPSCVPPLPGLELSGADLHAAEIAQMLSWPEVAGLAEVMDMYGVLQGHSRMSGVVAAGLASGKIVSGHAAGLAGAALQAYLAAGISSDHEVFAAGEVVEKLRAGLTVELRGMLDAMLAPLVADLAQLPELPPTLVAATDDLFALTLLAEGGIDHLLRRLVAVGMPAVRAVRLATLHAAFRLGRSDLGLVAAGRQADLVVLDDLQTVTVGDVVSAGLHVARGGRMLEQVVAPPNDPPLGTVHVRPLTRDDFVFRIPVTDGVARVRTLAGGPVTTHWGETEVLVTDGVADIPPGHLLQVAVHRHGRVEPAPVAALLAGWGSWTGAVATTVAHDTHNLVVFGRDPADMLAAAEAVVGDGGGVAVARGGRVIARIALPIAGLLSPLPAAAVADAQRRVQEAALTVGMPTAPLSQPLFHVLASSLACLPGPHLTDLGVVDGDTGRLVPSVLAS
jgi:adenine deaminase